MLHNLSPDEDMIITLRLLHIVLGALWVGMMFFSAVLLMPAIQDAGPDGGKVMAAMQRRGVMTVLPLVAIVTLLSGFGLYWIVSGHFHGPYMRSRTGMAFGTGGSLALIAWLLGMVVMRPSMMRAGELGARLATAGEAERGAMQAELGKLRARGAFASRAIVGLLLLAVALMAVARYL